MSRLGLPSKYDYWLAEYSPIIPQKSITTAGHDLVDVSELNTLILRSSHGGEG